MRLRCLLGFHRKYMPFGFVRRCSLCGGLWWVDYFEWRADGFPTWRRIEYHNLPADKRQELNRQLKRWEEK